MSSSLRIVVTGLIGQHPMGGVAWDYVQFPLGLDRLGHDVYYLEDSGEWPYRPEGGARREEWLVPDCGPNVAHLAAVMEQFGLGDRWAYRCPMQPPRWFGLSDRRRNEVLRSADLLINVSGTLRRPDEYRSIPRLAYIDSDPVFTQIKLARGSRRLLRRVGAHDVHFSFGERLPADVPATGHDWRPTRQPIVLSEWRPAERVRDAFTTVMNWTSYDTVVHAGRRYGQKNVEFRRFLELPRLVRPTTLEVAVKAINRSRGPGSTLARLARHGWRVADPALVSRDLDSYRSYVATSRGEWSVAKNGYVQGSPGWFSCRSACYLAAGRPVVVQDTGFSRVMPAGEGLLAFSTLDEAAEGIRAVEADYGRHARAARAIAEAYFDSDKVLTRLVEKAMSSSATAGAAA
jgi:hypothetical protein